jgi:hypothetical protein
MHHTNSEFHLMHAYGIYLMALHQQDLLEEAEISRRVKLAQRSQPGIPAWRRAPGRSIRRSASGRRKVRAHARWPRRGPIDRGPISYRHKP